MGKKVVKAGTVIGGRYRLTSPLSRGGMGSVWRAEHLALGSPIAIKLIDVELVEHDESRARFEQEARAAAALRSPHVVQILDHGVDDDLPFIAMELLDGESLATRLHKLGTIPAAQTARVFQDVARAIKKAHDMGVIHRDLKPDNIFLVQNDDREIAKVLDFGIAKALHPFGEQQAGTRTGALLGTPQYMSPEQARGLPIGPATDLWALGVIAFECVCGSLPFPSEKPGELIMQICAKPLPVPSQLAEVPPRFDAWFARACQREPERRFSSAKELADTLGEVLVGAVPTTAGRSGRTSTLGPSGTQLALDNSFLKSGAPAPASAPVAAARPVLAAAPPGHAPAAAVELDVDDAKATLQMPSRELRDAALAEAARRAGMDSRESIPEAMLFRSRFRSKKTLLAVLVVAVGLLGLALYLGLRDEGGSAPPAPAPPAPSLAPSGR